MVLLALVVSLALLGCRREPQEPRWGVATDLLALAPSAEVQTDTGRVEFAASEAGRYLGNGWGRYEEAPSIGSIVWATAKTASVRLISLQPGAGELVLRCAPAGGPQNSDLDLSLTLNGTHLETIRLEPKWLEYRVEVPIGIVTAGQNLLQLGFSQLRTPRTMGSERSDGRSLAAQFDYIELRPQPPNGTPPQAAFESRDHAWLQRGPSRVNFYLELPPRARLAGRIAAASQTDLRVELQTERGAAEPLFQAQIDPGSARPIRTELDAWGGQLVRLSLVLENSSAARWTELAIQVPQAQQPPANRTETALARLEPQSSIIVVVFDAAAARHFGCYGYDRPTSPTVDAIAAEPEAVLFERAYANAPYTLASTGSLFTGLYPEHHGVVERDFRLADDAVTWAELLREGGYSTAAFSMNAFASANFGYDQGFDFFLKKHKFHLRVPQYLASQPRRPLFLYLHYINPHAPYQSKPRFRLRFVDPDYRGPIDGSLAQLRQLDRGTVLPPADLQHLIDLYDADVASVDAEFGQLLAILKRQRLYDDALLILTSDHGEAFFEHGRRGHNTTVYDEMLHIPLLIKFPKGMRPRQRRVATPVQSVDLMPTVLELAGVPPPAGKLDGRSLLPLVFGEATQADHLLVARAEGGVQIAVRDARYKLLLYDGPPGLELFDLETDPGETRDRSAALGVRTGYLLQRLRMLRQPGPAAATATANQVDEETRAELRALGYL